MIARVLIVVVVCLACAVALPGCITINNAPIHTGWDQEQMAAHVQERFWFGMQDEEAENACRSLGLKYRYEDRRVPDSEDHVREMRIGIDRPGARLVFLYPPFNDATLALEMDSHRVRSAWYEPPKRYNGPKVAKGMRRGYPIALWERGS